MEAPDRTQIEALKAAKRAQREAREASGVAEPAAEQVPAAAAPPPEPVQEGALALLVAAETLASSMRSTIAAVNASLAGYKSAPSEDAAAALQSSVTALSGQVGKLQGLIDEVSIGDLDEDARDAARARRKKLNAAVEEKLTPAVAALRKATSAAALAA